MDATQSRLESLVHDLNVSAARPVRKVAEAVAP
jgi:hypothetical protein